MGRHAVFLLNVSNDVSVCRANTQASVWQQLQDVRISISKLEQQKKTVSEDVRLLVVSMAPPSHCVH